MSDISAKMPRLRQLRNAALAAVVLPAALLAACAAPEPAPPPPAPAPAPQSYVPAPQPAPPPVPVVRG